MDMSLSKLRELVKDREPGVLQSMGSQRVGHNWVIEQQGKAKGRLSAHGLALQDQEKAYNLYKFPHKRNQKCGASVFIEKFWETLESLIKLTKLIFPQKPDFFTVMASLNDNTAKQDMKTTEWTQFSSNWLKRDGDLKFNPRKNEKEWRKPNKNRGLPVRKIVCFIEAFPGGSDSKASVYNAGDLGSIPGSGRSPGEGNGNPLQYYCLENPMDGGAW